MKSLQESLFDDNIKKNLKFRDVFDVKSENVFRIEGFDIFRMFSVNKVVKYENPLHISKDQPFAAGFLGIIGDLPMPKENEFNKDCDWSKQAYKIIRKYISNSWKYEYDRSCKISLKGNHDLSEIDVEFEMCNGIGKTHCFFKRKNS